jgi:hypothetical protein
MADLLQVEALDHFLERGIHWLNEHRKPFPPTYGRRVRTLRSVVVHLPVGPAVENLFEGDLTLEPSQSGTHTEVDPIAEAQMVIDLAAHIELIGIAEASLVPIWPNR